MKEFNSAYNKATDNLIEDLLNKVSPREQKRIEYRMVLAGKIYAGMKDKGWKNRDLAKALNINSPSIVSKWLSGTHNFTSDTLFDIQEILEINLLDLEMSAKLPILNVTLTVQIEKTSVLGDYYGAVQQVIDESGGMQATIIAAQY